MHCYAHVKYGNVRLKDRQAHVPQPQEHWQRLVLPALNQTACFAVLAYCCHLQALILSFDQVNAAHVLPENLNTHFF